jgi:Mg/Co/Ni transporter MgtE
MVELKNKDILVINESLLYLNSMKTPAWYQISKNLRALKSALKEINDSKEDIVTNLSKKDDDGNVVYTGDDETRAVVFENPEEADSKWKAVLEENATKIDWYKFSFDKFGDIELDALAIEPLIDVCLTED